VVRAMLIARQRVAKIPSETNAQNNRISIARQRHGKQALLKIQTVFSVDPCKVVIRESSSEAGSLTIDLILLCD
jgi:hypothetical protein